MIALPYQFFSFSGLGLIDLAVFEEMRVCKLRYWIGILIAFGVYLSLLVWGLICLLGPFLMKKRRAVCFIELFL